MSNASSAMATGTGSEAGSDDVGFTFRSYEGAMLSGQEADCLMALLRQYGEHYDNHFGPDMVARLYPPSEVGGIFGRTAFCVADNKSAPLRVDAASHACVIYGSSKEVGLFGAVITDPRYRRRGLSKKLVAEVISKSFV